MRMNDSEQVNAYLNSITDDDFEQLKNRLLAHPSKPIIGPALRGLSRSQVMSKSNEGGGFAQAVKSGINLFNPWHWKQTIGAIQHNRKHSGKMTTQVHEYAQMAKDSYNKKERGDINNWTYNHQFSDKDHAVYNNGNQWRLAVKGTSQAKDILPDLNILTGTQNKSRDFKNSLNKYRNLKNKLGGEWEVVGHSLGGTKAMWIAQQEGIKSRAFNPGYVNATDDLINTKYKDHHAYVVAGDPISNTLLFNKLNNVTLLPAQGASPLKNHTIDNFLNPAVIQKK